jgi:hypothetical protein
MWQLSFIRLSIHPSLPMPCCSGPIMFSASLSVVTECFPDQIDRILTRVITYFLRLCTLQKLLVGYNFGPSNLEVYAKSGDGNLLCFRPIWEYRLQNNVKNLQLRPSGELCPSKVMIITVSLMRFVRFFFVLLCIERNLLIWSAIGPYDGLRRKISTT